MQPAVEAQPDHLPQARPIPIEKFDDRGLVAGLDHGEIEFSSNPDDVGELPFPSGLVVTEGLSIVVGDLTGTFGVQED